MAVFLQDLGLVLIEVWDCGCEWKFYEGQADGEFSLPIGEDKF